MDARVFMMLLLFLITECDASFGQVVRAHLTFHAIARQNLNVVHAHLARDVGHDGMPILKFDTEARI